MVTSLAYANDVVLCASTVEGLHTLLEITTESLLKCGLTPNAAKLNTISIKPQPKQKRTVIEKNKFYLHGYEVPALRRSDELKYQGVDFTTDGRVKYVTRNELDDKLDRLKRDHL